jgi:hypothetical protein
LEPTEEKGDFLAGWHKFCWLFQQSVLLHQKPWKFVDYHWIDSFDQRKDPERKPRKGKLYGCSCSSTLMTSHNLPLRHLTCADKSKTWEWILQGISTPICYK